MKFPAQFVMRFFKTTTSGDKQNLNIKVLHASGRLAPINIELDTPDTRQSKMDAFFCSTAADESNPGNAKKRKTASTVEYKKLSEPKEDHNHESTAEHGESGAQKSNV